MKKRFALIAGEVVSRTDGDLHWISAKKLCQLYKLNPDECYFVDTPEQKIGLPKDIAYLYPRHDGRYTY